MGLNAYRKKKSLETKPLVQVLAILLLLLLIIFSTKKLDETHETVIFLLGLQAICECDAWKKGSK